MLSWKKVMSHISNQSLATSKLKSDDSCLFMLLALSIKSDKITQTQSLLNSFAELLSIKL